MRSAPLLLAVFAACAPPLVLPDTEPPAPGFVRVGIVGWDSVLEPSTAPEGKLELPPSLWLPPLGEQVRLKSRSLHWFDITVDPEALLPEESRSVELVENGVALPVAKAQRLMSTDSGFEWKDLPYDNPRNFGWPSSDAPKECATLQTCVQRGVCGSHDGGNGCEPLFITAPEAAEPGCPAGWSNTATEGEWFCLPQEWVRNGRPQVPELSVDCPAGEANFGEGCEALETCIASTFAPVPPGASSIVYVDASAAVGGNGTLANPFKEMPATLATGSTVMIARGVYGEGAVLELEPQTQLIGTCAAEVLLQLNFVATSGEISLRGLRVESERPLIVRGTLARLRGVELRATDIALTVRSAGTASVARSLLVSSAAENKDGALRLMEARLLGREMVFVGNSTMNEAEIDLSESIIVGTVAQEPALYMAHTSGRIARSEFRGSPDDYVISVQDFLLNDGTGRLEFSDLRVVGDLGIAIEDTPAPISLERVALVSTSTVNALPADAGAPGLRMESAHLTVRDLAVHNFARGIILDAEEQGQGQAPDTSFTLNRGWIGWWFDAAIRAGSSEMVVGIEDLWLRATQAVNVPGLLDDSTTAIIADEGTWDVARVHARPRGRHLWQTSEATRLAVSDIEVIDRVGRLFLLRPGSQGEITRVRARGLSDGFVVLSDLGEPNQLVVSDIEFTVDPDISHRRGAAVEFFSGDVQWHRFRVRGLDSGRAEKAIVSLSDGHITVTDTASWNEDFRRALQGVSIVLESAQ